MTRYRGNIAKKRVVLDFLHPEKVKRAQIVGAAFDLAHSISGGVDKSLNKFSLDYNFKNLTIKLKDRNIPTIGEIVKKRIQTLCSYLRCEYSIIIK